MQYGFVLPIVDLDKVRAFAELANDAERAGWDAIFFCDWPWGTDPWVVLAAMVMRTERIRIGTMLTPISRRRPWKVASEVATLDHLSGGRVIFATALGAVDTGFDKIGEETDPKIRAQLLDEGLDIMAGFWSGQPFSYTGRHYQIHDAIGPRPVQRPRVPIWIAGGDKRTQLQRAALWDGVLMSGTPQEIHDRLERIQALRTLTTPLDVIIEGETPGDNLEKAQAIIQPLAEVGANWWLETMWWRTDITIEQIRTRIVQGPPR